MSLPRLIALFKSIQPDEYVMVADVCTIGRSLTCDIIVPAGSVSRRHARIERRGTHYFLCDAGSSHGTFVNGRRIQEPHLLRDQDLISLSSDAPVLRFEDPDSTLAGARLAGPAYLLRV